MEQYPGITSILDLGVELTIGSLIWRVVGGATMLDHVFTAKQHAEGHHPTFQKKFHFLGYLAINLGKIQIFITGTG